MAVAILGSGEGDEFESQMEWFTLTGGFDDMPNVRNLDVSLEPNPLTQPPEAPLVYPIGTLADFLIQLPPGFDLDI